MKNFWKIFRKIFENFFEKCEKLKTYLISLQKDYLGAWRGPVGSCVVSCAVLCGPVWCLVGPLKRLRSLQIFEIFEKNNVRYLELWSRRATLASWWWHHHLSKETFQQPALLQPDLEVKPECVNNLFSYFFDKLGWIKKLWLHRPNNRVTKILLLTWWSNL